jgi:hypothetical protein
MDSWKNSRSFQNLAPCLLKEPELGERDYLPAQELEHTMPDRLIAAPLTLLKDGTFHLPSKTADK